MKKSTRKKFSEEKRNRFLTGPQVTVPITDSESELREILGETMAGFQSQYDSDHKSDEESHEEVNVVLQTEKIILEFEEGTSSGWYKYTPAQLTQPKTEQREIPKKLNIGSTRKNINMGCV